MAVPLHVYGGVVGLFFMCFVDADRAGLTGLGRKGRCALELITTCSLQRWRGGFCKRLSLSVACYRKGSSDGRCREVHGASEKARAVRVDENETPMIL
jgi:hypothetical protein